MRVGPMRRDMSSVLRAGVALQRLAQVTNVIVARDKRRATEPAQQVVSH